MGSTTGMSSSSMRTAGAQMYTESLMLASQLSYITIEFLSRSMKACTPAHIKDSLTKTHVQLFVLCLLFKLAVYNTI